jgi:hypothetical protein
MGRKLKKELLERLTKGDLLQLLDYVKSDNELRLEVRRNGEAFIYYRKGKALEIGSLKVDKKYGEVPSTEIAITNPSKYFKEIKEAIDIWLLKDNTRSEFDTQQNIAKCNQSKEDKYLIIDMEYEFEQNEILKEEREKGASIDLLGVECSTGKIILFEVKTGLGAIKNVSGINAHIIDFEAYINGKHKELFRKNLFNDVKNIIGDKIQLGLIKDTQILNKISKEIPELIFVFHPNSISEITQFEDELKKSKELIIVSNSDYKLK